MSVAMPGGSDHDHPLPELATAQSPPGSSWRSATMPPTATGSVSRSAETTPPPCLRSSASGRQGMNASNWLTRRDGAPVDGTLEVVRTRRGWAVQFEDGTRTEDMTKHAAGQRMDRVAALRAEMAAAAAEKAALLEGHGIGEVDYRKLQPDDLFTWRPEVPPKTVTHVSHFDNGTSLIYWEDGRTPAWEALTLMTPSYPAYGQISDPCEATHHPNTKARGSRARPNQPRS